MTSKRFSFHRDKTKDDSKKDADVAQWYRLGLLGGIRPKPGHRPLESIVASSSASSIASIHHPPSHHKHFGLRNQPSETSLSRNYNSFRSAPASAYAPSIDRKPSTQTLQPRSNNATYETKKPQRGAMAGMLDFERPRSRRDRTFVGSMCAVCEEPLELTLRGERILQFSCTHISHEACFYEFIKEFDSQHCPTCDAPLGLDTSRGGNVLDLEKLSSIVRSVSVNDTSSRSAPQQSDQESNGTLPPRSTSIVSRQPSTAHQRGTSRESNQREGGRGDHWRTGSGASGSDYPETAISNGGMSRRHDYDVQSMETALSPRGASVNPTPVPTVVVRSEFPTLTRSKQQQSVTCIVTVEVPARKLPSVDDYGQSVQPPLPSEDVPFRPSSPSPSNTPSYPYQRVPPEALEQITEDLMLRVENWHGLDFSRFGKLRLFGTIKVGKDMQSWQELECYLFGEMLICVKEKRTGVPQASQWANGVQRKKGKCTLKGSILIKKHLKKVSDANSPDEHVLTLSLSVAELPSFHLQFPNQNQLEQWRRALIDLNSPDMLPEQNRQMYDQQGVSDNDDDDSRQSDGRFAQKTTRRVSSVTSSYGPRSAVTAPTEYSSMMRDRTPVPPSVHFAMDVVVVIPVSVSMQGLKLNLLRDSLKFLVANIGDRDRMGLVTFGSSGGGVPIVGMTAKSWQGWSKAINSLRPVGQKSLRADVVDGANVAMDMLMSRKVSNPLASILLISDSSSSEIESVDFVVSRAEAAKITMHSFGLGLTHKPDSLIELSTRTKGTYTYVKEWMMLRECLAGCLGALQSLSHQNAKLRLKLPEGSPARFVKISGALQVTKRATGREAEASLGDLHFGEKKDVLVQLVIEPDDASGEVAPQDAWETIVSGLEALGGPVEQDEQGRIASIEELPLIQAHLQFGDVQREGALSQLPRPSLLVITMLPSNPAAKKGQTSRPPTPPIPPHPGVVQRRMELLTSDMLSRALTLIARGQGDRAQHLLSETRTILRGLGKGSLPPIPPSPRGSNSPSASVAGTEPRMASSPSPPADVGIPQATSFGAVTSGIDPNVVPALDAELEAALEWINHPAVFSRDSRKAVLQAIGVISCQRGITFRTPCETLWAQRIAGVRKISERAREWRDADDQLLEEDG